MITKSSQSSQIQVKFPSFSGYISQNLPITSQFHALRKGKTDAIIPTRLVERHIAPGDKTETFHTQFGRFFIMKNTFAKNLVKSMSAYGEMLNRIGG